ncbi:hypothetical protein TrRE_jg5141 [Triparma retinervis]|uniref:Uncharacterized protein n=1 Tax=Triparma retinervis TaxID=2557542 RepID=A0A9W7A496_9STRA|nr:hypothetical protein TrRE_jg5141 [Triparma retinervis]
MVSSVSGGRNGGGWVNKNTFTSTKRRKIDEEVEGDKEVDGEKAVEGEKVQDSKDLKNLKDLKDSKDLSPQDAIKYNPLPLGWTRLSTDPCVDCGDGSYKEYEYVMYEGGRGGRREVGGRVKRTGGTEGSVHWDGEGVKVNFVPSGVNAERGDKVKTLEGLEGYDKWDDVGRRYFKRIWDKGVEDEGYFTYGWWVIERGVVGGG